MLLPLISWAGPRGRYFMRHGIQSVTIMGKGKKKHSKKDQVSEDMLGAAALSIKKFRKVTKEITKLSTGQKVVGGFALLAAGLTYWATQSSSVDEKTTAGPVVHQLALPAASTAADPAAEPSSKSSAVRKSRKNVKAKHES